MAEAYLVTYKALITEDDIEKGYANKNGTIDFEQFVNPEPMVAENVPEAAGANVTAAEFKALLDALIEAGLMEAASEE